MVSSENALEMGLKSVILIVFGVKTALES